jgi:hypothetical protein
VRTLPRHCSSDADLAWTCVERSTAQLPRALDATPATVPLSDAIRTTVVDSMAHQAATLAVLAWGYDGARGDRPAAVDETVRGLGIDLLVTMSFEGGTA